MNHAGSHQGHMWLIGAVAVGALLLGYGIGSAFAVAVIACVAMLGSIVWLMRRTQQPQPERLHRDNAHGH